MTNRYFVPLILACAPAWSQGWQPLDVHPRPDWARPWMNLNGAWQFDFDPEDAGVRDRWFETRTFGRTIQVPFPWQSELSGIHDTRYNGVAWYQREIAIPADAGPRLFLVFGAIDWSATVWVNGKEVASHEGGYVPFDVELTELAKPGETVRVTVRAVDHTEADLPTGKQIGWYTQTGGIWQTVYLESRGNAFIQQGHVYPDIDQQRAEVRLALQAPAAGAHTVKVTAKCGEQTAEVSQEVTLQAGENQVSVMMPIPNPALWSPETPSLYDAELVLLQGSKAVDIVHTYFGMRKISRGVYGGSTQEYILLNNKPVYLRGALHQSFNPKGIYTHPDDAFIRQDYEKTKGYGLNCLRIHIKTEEPRALYWADKLGVMLLCDVPNFWKMSERSNAAWEATLRAQVARDFNHPAIVTWVDFNETWGIGDQGYDRPTQEWVQSMWKLTKELDPTRLAEDNSPCNYDHVVSDINSWHFYIDDFGPARDHIAEVVEKTVPGSQFNYAEGWLQDTAPLMNSEYGGVSAGSGDRDISWVFLFLTNLLRKYEKINGYIYTELSDIEWEHNGFMNYDRSDKVYEYPADITVADLQGAEFLVMDCPPYQEVKAGDAVSIPVLLSHWSETAGLKLRLSVHGQTVDGRVWTEWVPAVERPLEAAPFKVTPQGSFDFTAPNAGGLMKVVGEVFEGDKRVAANYCVVHVTDGERWPGPTQYVVSIPVDSFSDLTFAESSLTRSQHPGKVYGFKNGYVEYQIQLPDDFDANGIEACRLIAEIGAKADRELVDWPERVNRQDYPQTDGRKWPSDVTVTIAGVEVSTVAIESDFADARGVLSHVAQFHHGSHGTVANIPLEGEALAAVKSAIGEDKPITLRFEVKADAPHVGGLALYGASMGRTPLDPTLLFTLAAGAEKPKGEAEPINPMSNQYETVLQTGPNGHQWRYITSAPAEGWQQPDFDDESWSKGKAGFGTAGTPGARIGTEWNTADIWLRTTVKVPALSEKSLAWLSLHHDEDVEVFVNGKPFVNRRRFASDYEQIPLGPDQRSLFQPGKQNTIAVHCHQTGGGQFVDLGLTILARD